jgi:hypothetical protein
MRHTIRNARAIQWNPLALPLQHFRFILDLDLSYGLMKILESIHSLFSMHSPRYFESVKQVAEKLSSDSIKS